MSIILLCVASLLLSQGHAFNQSLILQACRTEDGYYKCRSDSHCLPRYTVHDGFYHCSDKSDEGTNPLSCTDDEYYCRVAERCIRRDQINTNNSCAYDERLVVPCRSNEEFTCPISKRCIKRWAVTDGGVDCSNTLVNDRSDEVESLPYCLKSEFLCDPYNVTHRCIPREWVGDGAKDCPFTGNDETFTFNQCLNETEFRCVNEGRCIPRYRVVDGFNDCIDGSDEANPIMCLPEREFQCRTNGRCLPRSWRGNNHADCPDGSDEIPLSSSETCTNDEFRCHNGRRCIPRSYLCDGLDHCGDCSDEIESCDDPRMFRCHNSANSTCIHWEYSCDTYIDCENNADDITAVTGFKCNRDDRSGRSRYCVIPQWGLEDEYASCDDGSDLCYSNGTFNCARCVDNKTIIAPSQICDGIFDCPDLSDECMCSDHVVSAHLCSNICYGGGSHSCKLCGRGLFLCQEDNRCITRDKVCDGKIDCPLSQKDEASCTKSYPEGSGVAEKDFNCDVREPIVEYIISLLEFQELASKYIPQAATRCDGVLECAKFEDECSERANCSNKPDACDTIKIHTITIPKSVTGLPKDEPVRSRKCGSRFNFVFGKSICDGLVECLDGEDETNCTDRFYCDVGEKQWLFSPVRVSNIDYNKVCDGTVNCKDGIDEVNCPASSHFYCENGNPFFVKASEVLDGTADCDDGSDECPESYLNSSAISSKEYLIKSSGLHALIWIMAVFALGGNIVVATRTIRTVVGRCTPSPLAKSSSVSLINNVLILNLSLADFVMGTALLIITIKNVQFSGEYCLNDKPWRTGITCNAVGIMTVLSSEASVLTLACLSSYRLFTIYNPIKSRDMKLSKLLVWILLIWLVAFVLSFLPLATDLSDKMITGMWISNNPFFTTDTITLDELKTFAQRASVLGSSNTTSPVYDNWYSLHEYLSNNYPEQSPVRRGYFGYYSASGVCIPRFYRTEGDDSDVNALSSFIIMFNFIALVYIAGVYILIYRHASRQIPGVQNTDKKQQQSRHMQRKITILILTDMICWLPICIMTFISISGSTLPSEAYAISAIVLLPINSSLNPIIYTDAFSNFWGFAKRIYNRIAGVG